MQIFSMGWVAVKGPPTLVPGEGPKRPPHGPRGNAPRQSLRPEHRRPRTEAAEMHVRGARGVAEDHAVLAVQLLVGRAGGKEAIWTPDALLPRPDKNGPLNWTPARSTPELIITSWMFGRLPAKLASPGGGWGLVIDPVGAPTRFTQMLSPLPSLRTFRDNFVVRRQTSTLTEVRSNCPKCLGRIKKSLTCCV